MCAMRITSLGFCQQSAIHLWVGRDGLQDRHYICTEDTCVVGTNVCMDLIRVEVRVKLAV